MEQTNLKEDKEKECNRFLRQDRLFIRQKEYFNKILFAEIRWIEACRSYCFIYMADNHRFIVTYPMADVMKKLPPEMFIQTHRSFLVNINYVDRFIGNVLYIGKQSIPISQKYRKGVLQHFVFLGSFRKNTNKKDKAVTNDDKITDYPHQDKCDKK